MTNSIDSITTRSKCMLEAYRHFLNYYSDPDQLFPDLLAFLEDPDIQATLQINLLDDYENAIHIHFNYDSCDVELLATFNSEYYMTSIMVSTDTMPYEMMIIDPARR